MLVSSQSYPEPNESSDLREGAATIFTLSYRQWSYHITIGGGMATGRTRADIPAPSTLHRLSEARKRGRERALLSRYN